MTTITRAFEATERAYLDQVTRSIDARIDDVNQSERTMVFKANTSGLDRYNSVIEPRGIDFSKYRSNPVFLWEHGRDPRRFTDPIGRGLWVRHSGGENPKEVLVKKRFATDEFSDQRYQMYRDGILNAVSVRVAPKRIDTPTREEMRARPELVNDRPNETRGAFDGPLMIRECELLEISGTAVPGNADCLVVERAVQLLDFVERGMLWLPDDVRPLVEARARTMTDSTGGLEGGGEMAETDEDRGYEACPQCGKPAMKGGKCEAGHDCPPKGRTTPGSTPVVSKSAPAGPWIETDGQTWTVYAGPGVAVARCDDAAVAEQARAFLAHPSKSFEQQHFETMQALRSEMSEFRRDIADIVALYTTGRV